MTGQVSPRAERWLHTLWGSGLTVLILLPLLAGALPPTIDVIIAMIAGIGLFVLSDRLAVGQAFLSVLERLWSRREWGMSSACRSR